MLNTLSYYLLPSYFINFMKSFQYFYQILQVFLEIIFKVLFSFAQLKQLFKQEIMESFSKRLKLKKKNPGLSKHMKQFGYKYNQKTKKLYTDKNQALQKFGHGYFKLNHSFDRKCVSLKVKKFLIAYPCWQIEQSQIKTQEFQNYFPYMIEAHPKQIVLNHQMFEKSPFELIDRIRFPYLKVIQVGLKQLVNFEQIAWIQAPNLQQIKISTNNKFRSLKIFEKTNFKMLKKVELSYQDIFQSPQTYDIDSFFRTRLLKKCNQDSQYRYLRNICVKSIWNSETLQNISKISKLQCESHEYLTRWAIKNKIFNIQKVIISLSNKFQIPNKSQNQMEQEFQQYFQNPERNRYHNDNDYDDGQHYNIYDFSDLNQFGQYQDEDYNYD